MRGHTMMVSEYNYHFISEQIVLTEVKHGVTKVLTSQLDLLLSKVCTMQHIYLFLANYVVYYGWNVTAMTL